MLVVIHYPFFGGPQNQVLRLTAPLRELGWETIAVLPDSPGNAVERLRGAGLEPIVIPLNRLRASPDLRLQARLVGTFLQEIRLLRTLIRKHKIDIVQINGLINPHAAIAARMEGVPVVWQILDTRPPMWMRRLLMPIVRSLADVIMSTGVEVARAHPGARSLGSRLVPFLPPVDTAQFAPDAAARLHARALLGIPAGAPLVATVANLTPQKGLEYFLSAASQILRTAPDTRFAIFGAPMASQQGYADRIRRMAADLGLTKSGQLIIRDPGSSVALYLQAFDVFILSSVPLSEGIPTTVLEALATGVPVVATNVGGVHEVVEDGVTGYVVAPHSAVAIARATHRLLTNAELRRNMSRCARARAVADFDVRFCAEVHARAYEVAFARSKRRDGGAA